MISTCYSSIRVRFANNSSGFPHKRECKNFAKRFLPGLESASLSACRMQKIAALNFCTPNFPSTDLEIPNAEINEVKSPALFLFPRWFNLFRKKRHHSIDDHPNQVQNRCNGQTC